MCGRILLADHDDDALTCLANLLEGMGYETASTRSRDELLQAARDFQPNVVIVDHAMPGMDRHGVTAVLRARNPGHTMLLIALTGWGRSSDGDALIAAGYDVHLVKPVGVDQLRFILSMIDA
ncbi:response regulator [Paraburkholderia saeva]|jgi:CheY-like chemotaxis protein|uniref:Polar-differentiation response regulator DivK n=1 Tax=Paraburkholderia saeva TaxID=2777537 RepID=A0A9N8X328_9BURK|nr:response regulator [Paraburkholderia saeva]CAG4906430.1 Polar-differentiation response regulator DivK [Paraburkholderia saeva]CAG4910391.1 Polar-differentiation response regulator DivK [Paraburkholderia saeva]CAG4927952.1 Polar-differentiation response regulator DivK [Paraburkholderia saeva]